jgi:hypothetical protein
LHKNHLMKKLFLLLIVSVSFPCIAQRKAQQLDEQQADEQAKIEQYEGSKKTSFADKLYYGGNFGLAFSTNNSYFLLQPIVGYKLTEKFSLGVDPLFVYSSITATNSFNPSTKKFSTTVIGPGLFAKYNLIENIFGFGEYQGISFSAPVYDVSKADFINKDFWNNNLYLGGGYSSNGSGSGTYVMLLYNVLFDVNNTFYGRPYDIRIGFLF